MIFNFNKKYQFSTRLQLKGENIQTVDQMKILGTIVNSDLSWTDNCQYLIQKVNKRMQLIRNLISFGATQAELVHMWITFCRNILEQSCVIWHSQLTNENSENLERLQKTFTKLALKNKYKNYVQALDSLQLEKLSDR